MGWPTDDADKGSAWSEADAGKGPNGAYPRGMAHSTRVRRSVSSRRAGVVTSSRPDSAAWQSALALAGGDARRLVVISPTEILVQRTARHR